MYSIFERGGEFSFLERGIDFLLILLYYYGETVVAAINTHWKCKGNQGINAQLYFSQIIQNAESINFFFFFVVIEL